MKPRLKRGAMSLQQKNHEICANSGDADLIVLNSCAVTMAAAKKSRQIIRRLKRQNPNSKIAVSGCYSTLEKENLKAELEIDFLIPNNEKDNLPDKVLSHFALGQSLKENLNAKPFLSGANRTKAFIKVQDGCRNRCTFCIVTVARGPERSQEPQVIIEAINRQHQRGISEAVLTGVHLGGYGTDLGRDLTSLLKLVLKNTTIPRIRLGSLEPWSINNDFLALFENKRLMPHLHLPLQSGSDEILKRMARRCLKKQYQQTIDKVRNSIADVNISSDIIVGFPGESDSHFKETYELAKEMNFGDLHIFQYSTRQGTKAAQFDNQLSAQKKQERSVTLHELVRAMKNDFSKSQIGKCHSILIEGTNKGYTPNFAQVLIQTTVSNQLKGQIIETKITGLDETSGILLGKAIF